MAQIPLPPANHAAGTTETFGIQLFQRRLNPSTGKFELVPFDLTGYRVVVAVRVRSTPTPYTRDSNHADQVVITPKDGLIKYTVRAGDLKAALDIDQALLYQLMLDVPGTSSGPRGAFPAGQGTFNNFIRVV
jgi:hypothetical protein